MGTPPTKEYMAEYRKKNREVLLAKKKEYYHRVKNEEWFKEQKQTPEHKARHLAEARDYAARNVEKLKAYRAANAAARSAKSSAWNAAHREHRKAYMSAYQKANPEKFQEVLMRRRAIMKKSSPEERKAICSWIKGWRSLREVECHWCHGVFHPSDCHSDHVVSLGRDGPHILSNLVIACRKCNVTKNNQDIETWLKKLQS